MVPALLKRPRLTPLRIGLPAGLEHLVENRRSVFVLLQDFSIFRWFSLKLGRRLSFFHLGNFIYGRQYSAM